MCWSTINFFDQPVKRKQEANKKLVWIPKNHDYTTERLLDYCYDQNYFKLIGTDLSSQTNTSIRQQIIFTGKLEEDDGATMFFFMAEKLQKAFLRFSIDSLIVAI